MAKHVAVLLGGISNEREVSLSSGRGCAGNRGSDLNRPALDGELVEKIDHCCLDRLSDRLECTLAVGHQMHERILAGLLDRRPDRLEFVDGLLVGNRAGVVAERLLRLLDRQALLLEPRIIGVAGDQQELDVCLLREIDRRAVRLYKFSIAYLTALFALVALDALLFVPLG